eukprot:3940888-Rhodomonas_salina.1
MLGQRARRRGGGEELQGGARQGGSERECLGARKRGSKGRREGGRGAGRQGPQSRAMAVFSQRCVAVREARSGRIPNQLEAALCCKRGDGPATVTAFTGKFLRLAPQQYPTRIVVSRIRGSWTWGSM